MSDLRRRVERLTPDQKLLLRLLRQEEAAGVGGERAGAGDTGDLETPPFSLIGPADRAKVPEGIEDAFPLTRVQSGMLSHMEVRESGLAPPAYHNVNSWHVGAPFHEAHLREAIQRVVDAHPMLRVSFDLTSFSEPLQLIHRRVPVPLDVVDLRGLDAEDQERELDAYLRRQNQRLVDLTAPPLLRIQIHVRSDETFQLTLTEPHPISDGWSTSLNLVEIFRGYSALVAGEEPPEVTAPPLSFSWYVREERAALDSEPTRAFWRETLQDSTMTRLPRWPESLRPDPETQDHKLYFTLDRGLAADLRRLARRAEVPLKSVVFGAHLKVASLISGERDLLTGLVFNGRPEVAGGTELRGLFLNTLPFRIVLRDESWIDLVQRVFREETEILPHRRFPLGELQREQAGESLFEIAFGYLNFHSVRPIVESSLVEIQRRGHSDRSMTHFPLMVIFEISPTDPGLMRIVLEYEAEELNEEQIRGYFDLYRQVLGTMSGRPSARHGAAPLVPAGALEDGPRPLASPAPPSVVRPEEHSPLLRRETLVHRLFERQAERTPARRAVTGSGGELSYGELDRESNRVAHHLLDLGIGPDERVGLAAERGPGLVAAALGILKAGGTYVPLDPSLPEARLRFQLDDAGAEALIVVAGGHSLAEGFAGPVVDLEADAEVVAARPDERPDVAVHPESGAYVIYTSGSTGEPKGVSVSHRALVAYLDWAVPAYLAEGGTVPLHSSIAFDLTVTSLFGPLIAGGAIEVIADDEGGDGLLDRLATQPRYAMLKLTPTHLGLLREALPADAAGALCETMVIGGEALFAEAVDFLRSGAVPIRSTRPIRLINEYGPTEATVGCAVFELPESGPLDAMVPIGRPIPGVRLHVADSFLQPAPVATPGELCIGGATLARGYHRRPALTAERFIPDPFSGLAGARLYRTGDRAALRPDGLLAYLGRRDRQVKLHGYRIELDEVEAAASRLPEVAAAAVEVRARDGAEPELVAFAVAEDGAEPDAGALRDRLAATLPEYMVPSTFVFLDSMPTGSSGKIDRKALPDVGPAAAEEREYRAPRTETERVLAEIWSDILKLPRVGVDQNFFELGGDSISALLSVSKAKQAGIELTSRQLFRTPTIEDLAQVVGGAATVATEEVAATGSSPLTPIQQWFFDQESPDPHHFNQAVLLRLAGEGSRDAGRLERVVDRLLEHHDALRSRFVREQGAWRQVCPDAAGRGRVFSRIDLAGLDAAGRSRALAGAVNALQGSFDLSRGDLLRVAYFDLGPGEDQRLFLVAHHLVVDGVSWRILLDDLRTAYRQMLEGGTVALPPKTAPFRQWALALSELAGSDALEEDRAYWVRPAPSPLVSIPRDLEDGSNRVRSGRTVSRWIDAETTRLLVSECPRAYGARLEELLLAALMSSFADWLAPGWLRIDLEGHGREGLVDGLDVARTIGWFTALHPLDLEVGATSFVDAVASVRGQVERVPNDGAGYGLLRYLGDAATREALSDRPRAEISFNYFGRLDQVLDDRNELWIAPEPSGPSRSPRASRPHLIEVSAQIFGDVLSTDWGYSTGAHRRETIEGRVEAFLDAVRRLVAERPAEAPAAAGESGARRRLRELDLDLVLEEAEFEAERETEIEEEPELEEH